MRNKIIPFLLGCLVFMSIAASTATFMVVQPMKPKFTLVKSFRAKYFIENEVKTYIESKVREGYIVKSISMIDDESWSKGIVVMEKY